ncbi:hypothetical protein EVAR_41120_1 [Eumeta japonica]|uniref:Uncharacterized protein n=1 Tax=Eumeta variegata TaxID=151549 RepID=A0A4C1XAC7_EUMVA|nr:hypothetical protein EVAR_41120_1 [Eumeta japonica]
MRKLVEGYIAIWTDEWVQIRIERLLYGRMSERPNEWIGGGPDNQLVNGWIDGYIPEWVHELLNAWTSGIDIQKKTFYAHAEGAASIFYTAEFP